MGELDAQPPEGERGVSLKKKEIKRGVSRKGDMTYKRTGKVP